MKIRGIMAGLSLAFPLLSYSWNCENDYLQGISSYYDGNFLWCSYSYSGIYYYCYYQRNVNTLQVWGYCERYINQGGAFYSEPLDLSNPIDYRFYGSCLFDGFMCSCDCDLGNGSSGGGSSGGGSSGGGPSINLCSPVDKVSNLLNGIKAGMLQVFIGSSLLLGLVSASVSVIRFKGWI